MSAREELAELLEEEQEAGRWASSPTADLYGFMADAILAAGYSKPRTITTVEELDAIPAWSVVRSEQATIWEKFEGNGGDFWAETMTLGKHPSSHIALPATVIYSPEES